MFPGLFRLKPACRNEAHGMQAIGCFTGMVLLLRTESPDEELIETGNFEDVFYVWLCVDGRHGRDASKSFY